MAIQGVTWSGFGWKCFIKLRGVPTKERKPCDDRYRWIEMVFWSMGTLILCDFCYFRSKKTTKITWDGLRRACDRVQTCLIFPLRWAGFPIKIGRNAQWVHPFSMNFNGFRSVWLYFSLKVHFRWKKWSFNGNTIYFRWGDVMPFDQNRIVWFRW